MPTSTASQFTEYKKRVAISSSQSIGKKSGSSSFSPRVSSVGLPLSEFLGNPTYKFSPIIATIPLITLDLSNNVIGPPAFSGTGTIFSFKFITQIPSDVTGINFIKNTYDFIGTTISFTNGPSNVITLSSTLGEYNITFDFNTGFTENTVLTLTFPSIISGADIQVGISTL